MVIKYKVCYKKTWLFKPAKLYDHYQYELKAFEFLNDDIVSDYVWNWINDKVFLENNMIADSFDIDDDVYAEATEEMMNWLKENTKLDVRL